MTGCQLLNLYLVVCISFFSSSDGVCDGKSSQRSRDSLAEALLSDARLRRWAEGWAGVAVPSLAAGSDIDKTSLELIRGNGYVAEEHDVTTGDGYILTLHRIPHGRAGRQPGPPPPPVILQHGLLSSSFDWIVQPPERALAYMLADQGYDVWLGNIRGNTYSRQHVNMTADDPRFWEFTWDQMGMYDMPAIIDYILATTGFDDLYYVGHSMGTTMFWVMMYNHPEYNAKVRLMQGVGPVARLDHTTSIVKIVAPFANEVEKIAELVGYDEFMPSNEFMTLLAEMLCEPQEIAQEVCEEILWVLCGYDPRELNETVLPVLIAHTPAGASTRTLVHYAQEINSKKFIHYDWGAAENRRRYGQDTPPEYTVEHVTCPVALFWSDNDILADPQDVYWLSELLPNLVDVHRITLSSFNHLDYLWAEDADKLCYNHIIENIKAF